MNNTILIFSLAKNDIFIFIISYDLRIRLGNKGIFRSRLICER